jgi:hypothetical protein
MESTPDTPERRSKLDAEYEAALAEYREWDRRAVAAMSCDIATAAQISLDKLRAIEARRERASQAEAV